MCDVALCVDTNWFLLPQQGKSLKIFRLFNWISLRKIMASSGNVKKVNYNLRSSQIPFSLDNRILMHIKRPAEISVLLFP